MNDNNRRAFFYGMGALYVIYLAIKMLTEMDVVGGVKPTIMIIFAAVFALVGIGILIFAIKIAKKDRNEEKSDIDESETAGKGMD